ncbi:TcmI family type II polyketide cyclase [Candidatus Protofrankia californiensis]|uniref:TcmI family type II polyketide cyclase n=1 Tax=Candidatus Protofrankia californiensis TaxID=1839754 RepID=UPI001041380D|nr:TcmI family type II polyketide cyclase [Candidatus Protofrankia californiensis]
MHRSLIVAKITPGAEKDVARIFAESDATGLPRIAGVAHRSLYSLGDLYVHLLETTGDGRQAVDNARGHEEFKRVSDRLSRHIQPYLPTWRSPQDAIAQCFYTYETESAGEAA